MKDIYTRLKEINNKECTELIIMDEKNAMYWLGLPSYAFIYIKKAYDQIFDEEGLRQFVHHFLLEYSITDNPAKKMCIETIVFPLYQQITGRNYDSQLIAL